MGRLQLKEMMKELDKRDAEDRAAYDEILPVAANEVLAGSEKYAKIRQILNSKPILVGPCLDWLNVKLAQLAQAELATLYSPEQIETMKAELAKEK